jgi:hypothetical protein
MRALRVLGIAENGAQIVCQPVSDTEDAAPAAVETFALPVDERLRAAVRGDLTRIGQLEIEMESQLRPKEIQQRIRAGSTVEQVAAAAGCSPDRIERYAYPVLLERSTIAQRARQAHPVVDGVTMSRPVEDLVADTLAARGHQSSIGWDAFRDERGWALRASWKAGRSENHATWSFHAGPGGGTVLARDEGASMLVDPAPRPLRTVGAGGDSATATSGASRRSTDRSGASATAANATAATAAPTSPATNTPVLDDIAGMIASHPAEHEAAGPSRRGPSRPAAVAPAAVAGDVAADDPEAAADTDPTVEDALDRQRRLVADTVTDARSGSRPSATRPAADAVLRSGPIPNRAQDTGTDGATTAIAGSPAGGPAPVGSTARAGGQGQGQGRTAGTAPTSPTAKRGQRPQMPSWEDVLLGTRTAR